MREKALEFDEIANQVFFPIYSVIAGQILERTGKTKGKCLDVGSGGGHLGLSMAQLTELDVVLLDKNMGAVEIAQKRIKEWGLAGRVTAISGDVQELPYADETFDLVISRGSVWFWEDQKKSLQEIYRVLKEGGMAYIGGGFANKELRNVVDMKMKARDSEWPQSRQRFVEGNTVAKFTRILNELKISNYEVSEDEKGLWVVVTKDRQKFDFMGYTCCPLKPAFRECFEGTLKTYLEQTGDPDFKYYIPAGCGGSNAFDDVWKIESIDEFPDIVVSAGFGDFFRQEFVDRFVKKGYFKAAARDKVHAALAAAGVEDPDGRYTVYSVFPLVMLVDHKRLGELPVPRQWSDLLNDVYCNNIIIGASHGEINDALLLYIHKEHGDAGLRKFAANVKDGWHASQMAKIAGTANVEGAAVYVIPWMFAKSCPRTGATSIVWPADGALTSPAYLLIKESIANKLQPFVDFVLGADYGKKCADNYYPVLNPVVDNKLPDNACFKWLGWDYIKAHSIDTLREHVVRVFKQEWRKEGLVREMNL